MFRYLFYYSVIEFVKELFLEGVGVEWVCVYLYYILEMGEM